MKIKKMEAKGTFNAVMVVVNKKEEIKIVKCQVRV